MEDETETAARVERLHDEAEKAQRRAADARRLAMEIGRRRELVLVRDDAAAARHTPEVWSSVAASASREDLRHGVGSALWSAGESLRETQVTLEQEAQDLEGAASSYRRQVGVVLEDLQATRSVSSTSLAG